MSWGAGVVKTLLTETTLASKFNGFTTDAEGGLLFYLGIPLCGQVYYLDDQDEDESDDLEPESYESSGSRVLRHLTDIVASHAAIASLLTPICSKIIRGELSLGLLEIPHTSFDIAHLDDICEAYFTALSKPSEPVAYKDRAKSILEPHLLQTFPGTVHAEATLMVLLTYFSASSRRVAFEMPLRYDHVAALDKLLESVTTENTIVVGRKCYWCCDRLCLLLAANDARFKFPGSNGIIYPCSPPRVGVDVEVLQRLKDALFQELREAIDRGSSDLLSRQHPEAIGSYRPVFFTLFHEF